MRRRIKLHRSSSISNKIESDSIIPKESVTCKHFVTRFKQEQCYGMIEPEKILIHIPNENISSVGYRRHLAAMGLMAGVLDYMLLYKGGVAFIEFKRDTKCKLTPHQQRFIDMLKVLGIKYLVTCCIEEAITFCKNM